MNFYDMEYFKVHPVMGLWRVCWANMVGVAASRDRIVSVFTPFIAPIAMLFLSLFGVVSDFGFDFYNIALWCAAWAVVGGAGYLYKRNDQDYYDAKSKVFFLAGSWWYLFFILLIFLLKYCTGVFVALKVGFVREYWFVHTMPICYGALSGVFFVRSLNLLRLFFAK